MRKLIKLFVLLIVLIIGGVVAAYIYVDTIAKAAVEKGSTYALGVQTKLDGASVKVFAGQLVMKGLNVANPAGYQAPHFLTLKKGDVAVTLGTLRQPVIELPHLKLNELDVNLEKKEGKANYQVILDNLKKLESGAKPKDDAGTRYIIKKLTIKKATVHADTLPIGGSLARIDVPLDDILMKDIGADNGKGVTMGELTSILLKAVLTAAITNAGNRLPADLLGDLSGQLAGLKGVGSLLDLENLGSVKDLGTLGDKAKDSVNNAIGNLLGGDKTKK